MNVTVRIAIADVLIVGYRCFKLFGAGDSCFHLLATSIGDSKGKTANTDADQDQLWSRFLSKEAWPDVPTHAFASAWGTVGSRGPGDSGARSVMEILARTTAVDLAKTMKTAGKLASNLPSRNKEKCLLEAIKSGNVVFVDSFLQDMLSK